LAINQLASQDGFACRDEGQRIVVQEVICAAYGMPSMLDKAFKAAL
jgi:hypothetical protein